MGSLPSIATLSHHDPFDYPSVTLESCEKVADTSLSGCLFFLTQVFFIFVADYTRVAYYELIVDIESVNNTRALCTQQESLRIEINNVCSYTLSLNSVIHAQNAN